MKKNKGLILTVVIVIIVVAVGIYLHKKKQKEEAEALSSFGGPKNGKPCAVGARWNDGVCEYTRKSSIARAL